MATNEYKILKTDKEQGPRGFPGQTGAAGGVTVHNDLLSMQGGSLNEYYHINAADYALVSSSPGNNKYFGTNGSGVKAWYDYDAITGAGVLGQVAYWDSTTGLTGDANFTWSSNVLSIAGDILLSTIGNKLIFGDGDSYIYESADDQIMVRLAGTDRWRFTAAQFRMNSNGGPALQAENSSASNPVFCPINSDATTGIGGAANQLSFIISSTEYARITSSGLLVDDITELTGSAGITINSQLYFQNASSPTFTGGFAGSGWGLEESTGDYELTIDKLTVRKSMSIYQLAINKIRATNGALWVTDAIEITSVVDNSDGSFTCSIDDDSGNILTPFEQDDVVRCQAWNGRDAKYYTATVDNVASAGDEFTITPIDGTDDPEVGDLLVRIGNQNSASDRQGTLYLTSSDANAPYLDVLDEVDNHSLAGKTKLRIGNLAGITDASFGGALSGYGIWTDSAYLSGKLIVPNAGMVNDGATDDSIRIFAGDTYANRATAPFRVTQDGSLTATGIAELGTAVGIDPEDPGGKSHAVAIAGPNIYEPSIADDDGAVFINAVGYQGGTSYYRDTFIGNGKSDILLQILGESNTIKFATSTAYDFTTVCASGNETLTSLPTTIYKFDQTATANRTLTLPTLTNILAQFGGGKKGTYLTRIFIINENADYALSIEGDAGDAEFWTGGSSTKTVTLSAKSSIILIGNSDQSMADMEWHYDIFGSGGGSMVYPGAGIALSTGSAWGTSITNNSANWNTAFGWGDWAANFGAIAGKICQGNDSRLSDARTPISHDNTYHSTNYEAEITAGTTSQYWSGNKTWQTLLGITSSTAYRGDYGNTAYSERHQWDGGSTNLVAATGRTSLDVYSKSEVDAKIYLKSNTDNRAVDTVPNDYNAKFEIVGLKQNSTLGITGEGTYSGVLGIRGWNDSSGGNAHEIAFTGDGEVYHRDGATTTWNSWRKFYTSDDFDIDDYSPAYTAITSDNDNITLSGTDNNSIIECTSTVNRTITIPDVVLGTGFRVTIVRYNTGTVTVSPANANVTLHSEDGNRKIAAQYTGAVLYHRGSKVWVLMGKLEA